MNQKVFIISVARNIDLKIVKGLVGTRAKIFVCDINKTPVDKVGNAYSFNVHFTVSKRDGQKQACLVKLADVIQLTTASYCFREQGSYKLCFTFAE